MRRQTLPVTALPVWAKLNGIEFHGVGIEGLTDHGIDKGSAVVARRDITGKGDNEQLMLVPKDMILSLEAVGGYAKSDKYLREVLEAVGDYARTARGAVLIFLLLQITTASPDVEEKVGVSGPWTEYVKFLPEAIPLPTFWSEAEQELLAGTSLHAALQAKSKSLVREFDHLKSATESISWCQRHWWDDGTGKLPIDSWKLVDAMYRSRALDLPDTGHAMVPCIDMANHASGDNTSALYETDMDGNGVLLLREGKSLVDGEEVTITYGDEKGACEMIFSYGFVEQDMVTAKELFLDLDIPDDDPLKFAKKAVSRSPPGFRLFSTGGAMSWEGDFIWLICVNEEDGLDFQVKQTKDGGKELEVHWRDVVLADIGRLKEILTRDHLWEVFQLRATAILQDRVQLQLSIINASEEQVQSARGSPGVSRDVWQTITRLRELECALLSRANQDFEQVKQGLMESKTVQEYPQAACSVASEDDYS